MQRKRRRRSRHRFDQIPNVAGEEGNQMPDFQEKNEGTGRTEEYTGPNLSSDNVAPWDQSARERPGVNSVDSRAEEGRTQFVYSPCHGGYDEFSHGHIEKPGDLLHEPWRRASQMEIATPVRTWRVLWALLRTSGTQRMTKEQYQSVRLLSEYIGGEECRDWKHESFPGLGENRSGSKSSYLPHYSTLQKFIKPVLFRELTVRRIDHSEPVNLRKPGARSRRTAESGEPRIDLRTVLPSEYARSDIATPQVFDAIRRTSLSFHEEHGLVTTVPRICSLDCIDIVPLIAAREWFYGEPRHIYVDKCCATDECTFFAEAGDSIRLTLMTDEAIDERFARCFLSASARRTGRRCEAQGTVVDVWTVRHETRKGEAERHGMRTSSISLTRRDKLIRSVFDFVSYTSPTDSISMVIPDVLDVDDNDGDCDEVVDKEALAREKAAIKEAKKLRRAAQRQRKILIEDTWKNWQKPVLKPGDVVALLCPYQISEREEDGTMMTATDNRSRLLLINRHWIEDEERSMHILWVPGGSEVEQALDEHPERHHSSLQLYCQSPTASSCSIFVYVTEVALLTLHPGERGPHAYSAVSSFGTLSTGELYFVYRFVLFWDGFNMQEGKEASGDGIYLLCLNFPSDCSRSPNDIRIISLTPPGVKSDSVLRAIVSDVVQGMTQGFIDIDADGNMQRIFLDLVGFIGDTPALNAFLDTLGHTACASCHLCRYIRRSETITGSRFTGRPTESSRTALQRGFFQEQAIRDCAPGPETCRLLGLKSQPDTTSTVLHYIRSHVLSAKGRVPLTKEGHPVVPCAIDPYKACFIAPDHLLTGHARDCINLGLQFLPNRSARELCETSMLQMLESCNLPAQTRLINHEKKRLMSMTMSELYALSLIAHHAFSSVIASIPSDRACSMLKKKCSEAVEIVRSVGKLIAEFWFKADKKRDSTNDCLVFEAENGNRYLMHMRSKVNDHIELVQKMCTMSDIGSLTLVNSTCSRVREAELARERSVCVLAKRTIDKPNVHRLRELVYGTLPMLGHASAFGELALEKTHQQLKRAVKLSNKKDAHIQAVDSAIFGDWQGRLSLVASAAKEDDKRGVLALFRLLVGRETVLRTGGRLQSTQKDLILGCLNDCILKELSTQGKSVLSHRAVGPSLQGNWVLKNGNIIHDPLDPSVPCAIGPQTEALALVHRMFRERLRDCSLRQSSSVIASRTSRMAGTSISTGDMVEALTLETEGIAGHYPFVILSNDFDCSTRPHAPSVWLVDTLFSIEETGGVQSVFAAVRPCIAARNHGCSHEAEFKLASDMALTILKLDASLRRVTSFQTGPDTFLVFNRRAGFPPRQG